MRASWLFSVLFIVLALPLGLRLVFLMPLGEVADEPQHVMRADSLLYGEWIGHRGNVREFDGSTQVAEGVDADRALLAAIVVTYRPLDPTPTQIEPNAIMRSRAVRLGSPTFSELGSVAAYFPAFYVPAALAIEAAKLFGHGARVAFLSARLANLSVALVLGTVCLLVAKRARPLLLGVLLTPQSISLMASASEDGLLIASSALVAALVTSLVDQERPSRQPAFAAAMLLVALVCLAKPPYLPMTCLLLLPLPTDRSRIAIYGFGERLLAIAGVCAATCLWTWATVKHAATPRYLGRIEAGPLWPGPHPSFFISTNMRAQLDVLLHPATRLILLPLHTIAIHPEVFAELIDRLAWLNLFLPLPFVLLWGYALTQSIVGEVDDPSAGRRSIMQVVESVMLLGAASTIVILIYVSLYLGFTPVGLDWISGVQGRYLLPILPMIGLAITTSGVASHHRLWALTTPIVFAAALGIVVIPHSIWAFFHSRGF